MDKQQRRQEHFNKAYLGVIAQGKISMSDTGTCLYLSPYGAKCNVGHILSEKELEKYGSFLGSVDSLWDEMAHNGEADSDHPFKADEFFYLGLQEVHDNLMTYEGEEFVSNFKYSMASFAQRYNLTVPDETATA